jgi:hypothetical protein
MKIVSILLICLFLSGLLIFYNSSLCWERDIQKHSLECGLKWLRGDFEPSVIDQIRESGMLNKSECLEEASKEKNIVCAESEPHCNLKKFDKCYR